VERLLRPLSAAAVGEYGRCIERGGGGGDTLLLRSVGTSPKASPPLLTILAAAIAAAATRLWCISIFCASVLAVLSSSALLLALSPTMESMEKPSLLAALALPALAAAELAALATDEGKSDMVSAARVIARSLNAGRFTAVVPALCAPRLE